MPSTTEGISEGKNLLFYSLINFYMNLSKGGSLNLVKADGSALSKARVGLSWDVKPGVTADLDLFIVGPSKSTDDVAYFGKKDGIKGVILSDDNRTGEGDGDDEFAKFDATVTTDGVYTICLNIYNGGVNFDQVANPKVTVYNDETNEVLATFELGQGGAHNGFIVGTLTDAGDTYVFTAKGDAVNGNIEEIVKSL
jgi:tellurium resistance protein TerD